MNYYFRDCNRIKLFAISLNDYRVGRYESIKRRHRSQLSFTRLRAICEFEAAQVRSRRSRQSTECSFATKLQSLSAALEEWERWVVKLSWTEEPRLVVNIVNKLDVSNPIQTWNVKPIQTGMCVKYAYSDRSWLNVQGQTSSDNYHRFVVNLFI